jgi:hypothetical protein
MAAFFLVLAVIVGVVIGDAVVANTGASNVQLFDHTITGFTLGQLLVIAAATGFLLALLLISSWSSSRNRRLKRRELRATRRNMKGRIGDLERENAGLRDEVDRDRRTTRLGELDDAEGTGETTQVSRSIFPRRAADSLDERATATGSTARRDAFDQADR